MNISMISATSKVSQNQGFKGGKGSVVYNEARRPLSNYTAEHIKPTLDNLHGIAKQYNLPVTIADLGKKSKGVVLLNSLFEKLGMAKRIADTPQVTNRILVNIGSESRIFDPNEIPLDKFSGKIEDFVREVSEKRARLSKPLSESEKLDYIKEHAKK